MYPKDLLAAADADTPHTRAFACTSILDIDRTIRLCVLSALDCTGFDFLPRADFLRGRKLASYSLPTSFEDNPVHGTAKIGLVPTVWVRPFELTSRSCNVMSSGRDLRSGDIVIAGYLLRIDGRQLCLVEAFNFVLRGYSRFGSAVPLSALALWCDVSAGPAFPLVPLVRVVASMPLGFPSACRTGDSVTQTACRPPPNRSVALE